MRSLTSLCFLIPWAIPFAGCGGSSSGGSSEPDPVPNEAPAVQVPGELSGGPVEFLYTLPMELTASLTFTATDANGDPLMWQIVVSAGGVASAGLSYSSPVSGSTFTMDLEAVAAPTTASINVLVEDPAGAAAAIDILLVRSGSPTLTDVTPSSAFATAPQDMTFTGSAFSLSSTANTLTNFSGVAGSQVVVVDESTLTCLSPAQGVLGPNTVGISSQYGSAQAPQGSFGMYDYPVDLFDNDDELAGDCTDFEVANAGPLHQIVWIEADNVRHCRSLDAGATWSPPQTLNDTLQGPRLEPQVVVDGTNVTVGWIYDDFVVRVCSSTDGGLTFTSPQVVNDLTAEEPANRLRMVINAERVYCSWLEGFPPFTNQLVAVVSSTDQGSSWSLPQAVSDQGADQFEHTIGCDGLNCWIAYREDSLLETGVYTSRSSDGGILWTAGVRRSPISTTIGEIESCNTGARAYLVWVRDGQLEYMTSENAGADWPTQPTLLRDSTLGSVSLPVVACEGERLFAAYVTDNPITAGFSRVGALGAVSEHVTISDPIGLPSLEIGQPDLTQVGNYVFVTYREVEDEPTDGLPPGYLKFASSVDRGLTFEPAVEFGNRGSGTGQSILGDPGQEHPRMLLDGARIWLGWIDYRGGTPELFQNRTEQ